MEARFMEPSTENYCLMVGELVEMLLNINSVISFMSIQIGKFLIRQEKNDGDELYPWINSNVLSF